MSERRCQIYGNEACFSLWLLSVFTEMWKDVRSPRKWILCLFPNLFCQFISINRFSGQPDKVRQLHAVFPASYKGVTRGYFSLMNLLSPDSPSVVSKEKWFPSGGRRT